MKEDAPAVGDSGMKQSAEMTTGCALAWTCTATRGSASKGLEQAMLAQTFADGSQGAGAHCPCSTC